MRTYSPSPSVFASQIPLYMRGAACVSRTSGSRVMRGLGQDAPQPFDFGGTDLTDTQIAAVTDSYNSGALSDAGLNQILDGNVPAANLTDFMNSDPGQPQQPVQDFRLADGSIYHGTLDEYQAYLASGNAPGPSSSVNPAAGTAATAAAAAAAQAARTLATPAPSPRIAVGTPQTFRLPDGSSYYGTPAEYQAYLQRTGQGSGWFSGSTPILGVNIPNVGLLIGGGLLLLGLGGKRR